MSERSWARVADAGLRAAIEMQAARVSDDADSERQQATIAPIVTQQCVISIAASLVRIADALEKLETGE